MVKSEIISRLKKIGNHAIHVKGESPFVMSLDDGIAVNEAIDMLKEQEAVTEYVIDEYQPTCKACGFRPFAGYIPSLEWMRERGFKFCPQCGRAVKWNDNI